RQLEDVTGMLIGHFDACRALAEAGRISTAEARQRAFATAGSVRFGNADYFFVYDRQAINLAHADTAMIGRDLSRFVDVRGTLALQEMLALTARQDSGYCSFWYHRLGDSTPVEKLSFIRRYDPWQCFVGTGVYIDDIQRDADAYRTQLTAALRTELADIEPGQHSRFAIIDDSGVLVAHPALTGALPLASHNCAAALRAFAAGERYRGWFDVPGATVTVSARRCPSFNWWLVAILDDRDLHGPVSRALVQQGLLLLLATLAAVLAALLLARRLTRPLPLLAEQARVLARGGVEQLASAGTACRQLATGRDDELGELAQALAAMTAALERHISELAASTAAQARLAGELDIARDIQRAMLKPPRVSSGVPCTLAAYLAPAEQIGGDLYFGEELADGRLLLAVGDVSGKGIPGALHMARTVTALRLLAADGTTDPVKLLTLLNAELCRDNAQCHFVTLWCGVYTPAGGALTYASAGHCLPLLRTADGQVSEGALLRGAPLGIRKAAAFAATTITLAPGMTLLVYTDGITEAQNRAGAFYGEQRLRDWLAAQPPAADAATLAAGLTAAVAAFADGAPPADDLTLLVLQRYHESGNVAGA
ncbi:MAG TPA: SpoIIE family protein phosphatase, partial [bacterium]|nr:SpoIIE family protein phosphatase [bacterium]